MQPELFETHRSKLFGIAYRMLGTIAEAEDAVQDTYLRWQQSNSKDVISNIEAYLVTTITRLCIDHLKSAKVNRENYVGTWLPEPLIEQRNAQAESEPEAAQELAQTLSYAFMMLLEQLNPVERAVYILREAFDFRHDEIAKILGRSSADSRQLSRRARQRLRQNEKRFEKTEEDQEALFARFLDAAAGNDLQPLFAFLAEDIALYSDGGGKVRAALRVLEGKARVIEFIERVLTQQDPASEISLCRVNGQPAIQQTLAGESTAIITCHFVEGKVAQLFIVRNPEKLHRNTIPHPIS